MLEKGYRTTSVDVTRHQKVAHPIFGRSGKGIAEEGGLCIYEVASDRSGNERAVRHCHLSNFLTNGIHQNHSFARLNKVWECFSFQVNFMRDPFL